VLGSVGHLVVEAHSLPLDLSLALGPQENWESQNVYLNLHSIQFNRQYCDDLFPECELKFEHVVGVSSNLRPQLVASNRS